MSTAAQRLKVVKGDITRQHVDAVVNAANTSLLGGGGVDGAIHRAAGPELLEACRKLGGCATGDAKITAGYDLPADYVIHAVGPVWHGGSSNEDRLLASCYRRSMELARASDARTVAFPAISCGAYRFPIERAARLATAEVLKILRDDDFFTEVRFVCFDDRTHEMFSRAVREAVPGSDSSEDR